MKVHCSLCIEGSPVTDEVKLKTIGGRDYLVCKECWKKGGFRDEKTVQQRNLPRVSSLPRSRDNRI
jgi:hypothetical protein